MKTLTSWFLLLLLSASTIMAQDINFGFQWGIGSFKMDDLKAFNSDVDRRNRLDTKIIEDFPAYYYYKPTFYINSKYMNLGLVLSFASTGSRHSLTDYSGEYLYDTRIKSKGGGFLLDVPLNPKNMLRVSLFSESGILVSNLMLKEYLFLSKTTIFNESQELKSTNVYWEPGLKISYSFGLIDLFLSASYNMQHDGKGFHFEENPDKILTRINGDTVNPGWNGYRIGLGININMTKLAMKY